MKRVSQKIKIILAILPFLFGLLVMHPNIAMITPENQVISNENKLTTSQDAIFDGLYLNYTFTMGVGSANTNFSYSHISGNDYHVNWTINSTKTFWDENLDNRVISNSGGSMPFGDGNHAPIWIFTNSTIGQIIPIAVDGAGDHAFNITKEYAYNLPGFGTIDVWQLEDLGYPGVGVALYEKSTGFLIKGFFPVVPVFNYSFELVSTNLVFNYITPDNGIFDGLYIAHNYTQAPISLLSNFSFFEDPIGTYNVTWTVIPMGSVSWNEYITNRTVFNTGVSGFNEYSHTPIWINLDVNINDIVPITVDGVGDHNFQVKRSKVHNLIGFGWIEVWILQDLANSSAEVWYEKSTGLLIQGTFIWSAHNYTLEFVDTNAAFTYVNPPPSSEIPGYNLFLLIGLLVALPLVLVRLKKRK